MKLLMLAALLLAGAESHSSPREEPSWRRFGGICRDINVTNSDTEDHPVWTVEGNCGKYRERRRVTYDLDACVGNEDGGLVWRKGGSFSSTCESCLGFERGANVWLQCWRTKKNGEHASLDEYPMLDLNEHIAWDGSGLRCTL